MSRWLDNRWLSISIRVFLGAVFIYSAWPKLIDPPGFAHAVWNYRILPSEAINVAALILPWLEFVAGVALILMLPGLTLTLAFFNNILAAT